jgi:hypothetical protein
MLMGVAMGVLMAVFRFPVGMLVGVHMSVLVRMQMFVFVFSFHDSSPFHQVAGTLHGFVNQNLTPGFVHCQSIRSR